MGFKDKGQIIRTNCKRCGARMLKWERWTKELETTNPYPFEGVCGHCLTQREVDSHYGRVKPGKKVGAKVPTKSSSRSDAPVGPTLAQPDDVSRVAAQAQIRQGGMKWEAK